MIEHVWSVLCKETIIDKQDNNLFIQRVIEEITLHTAPKENGLLAANLQVVTFWVKSDPGQPETGEMRISFSAPTGKTLGDVETSIDLETAIRSRNIMVFKLLPISTPGRYYFRVYLKTSKGWKKVANIPLDVSFAPGDNLPENEQLQAEIEQV